MDFMISQFCEEQAHHVFTTSNRFVARLFFILSYDPPSSVVEGRRITRAYCESILEGVNLFGPKISLLTGSRRLGGIARELGLIQVIK